MKYVVKVDGMSCKHCAARVEEALSALPGVSGVKVKLSANKAEVVSEQEITEETFTKVIDDAGYEFMGFIN
ncbi:copper-binding protein [Clostridia bacterium]|nr:copper-binding protein [Clostridia bacterium]